MAFHTIASRRGGAVILGALAALLVAALATGPAGPGTGRHRWISESRRILAR
jgi:hypothetical protein